MYTEDSLAAAQIAKIFGSELLNVQEKSRMDSGTQPQILKMHPKQFLGLSTHEQQRSMDAEKKMLEQLQKEAEATHPLPPSHSEPQPLPVSIQSHQPKTSVGNITETSSVSVDVWEKINTNLERIANSLERVDVSIKKKRIKRSKLIS